MALQSTTQPPPQEHSPSLHVPLELQSQHPDNSASEVVNQQDATSLEDTHGQKLKLTSAAFSFFVAGVNDGSMGALVPYMLKTYHIGTSFIAILYFTTFLGWLVAALTNSHAPRYLGMGALLCLGAALQLLSQCLRPWIPPFALFSISFFTTGLGQAYQDSHANTFVSSVKGAHRWLGLIHAMYGFGCLVSPFVATPIASAYPEKWMLFYLFPLGLSVINVFSVLFAFWESVNIISGQNLNDEHETEEQGRNKSAFREIQQLLTLPVVWTISLFYFLYLGVCVALGGWVVQYMVTVRQGDLTKMGYVPSGFSGGTFLGRLLLAEPTHRWGERRMLLIYSFLSFVMQLVFWLVPNIISSAVSFSLMGFLLGPFFASGISVASRLFPKQIQPAALGLVFVVAQAGGALFPSLVGIIASHAGVKVLQPIIASLMVMMAISWAFVPKPRDHQE